MGPWDLEAGDTFNSRPVDVDGVILNYVYCYRVFDSGATQVHFTHIYIYIYILHSSQMEL